MFNTDIRREKMGLHIYAHIIVVPVLPNFQKPLE